MAKKNQYYFPDGRGTAEFFEKKSRFITHISHVTSREEAIAFVNEIKTECSEASHNCSAFILGNPSLSNDLHSSDDGEPSGTAGKPMLSILQYNNVGDVVVVVTRYFGGVKLGTGGLVRAYSRSVKEVLGAVKLCEFVEKVHMSFSFHYQHEGAIRRLLGERDVMLTNSRYDESVTFAVQLAADVQSSLIRELKDITSGSLVFFAHPEK